MRGAAHVSGLLEVAMVDRRVVRHEVEHDAHVVAVRAGYELGEIVVCSIVGAPTKVTGHCVAIVARRILEGRREPEDVDAELGELGQGLADGSERGSTVERGDDPVDDGVASRRTDRRALGPEPGLSEHSVEPRGGAAVLATCVIVAGHGDRVGALGERHACRPTRALDSCRHVDDVGRHSAAREDGVGSASVHGHFSCPDFGAERHDVESWRRERDRRRLSGHLGWPATGDGRAMERKRDDRGMYASHRPSIPSRLRPCASGSHRSPTLAAFAMEASAAARWSLRNADLEACA